MSDVLTRLWDGIKALFEQERRIKEVDSWDGSAARWPDAESYCEACLIDVSGEEKRKSHCMLPVREPGDSADTYVRQAVHAAAGGRGLTRVKRPDDVPAETWDAAVKAAANKLISAYKQVDEQAPDSIYKLAGKDAPERAIAWNDILQQMSMHIAEAYGDSYPWLNDIYLDNGQMYAVVSMGGKVYRIPAMLDGTDVQIGQAVEVEAQFTPVLDAAFRVARQADGRARWFAIAETAVLNRVGEIDSRALFESFTQNAQEHGYPELRFYHDPSLRMGEADWVGNDGNVYMASGLFDEDNPLANALVDALEKRRGRWGNSVGFTPLSEPEQCEIADGVTIPVYTAGVNREISVLPEDRAASWFTAITTGGKGMRKEVADALRQLFGDEGKANEFIALVDDTNRAIEDGGLVTRETETTEDVEKTVEKTDEKRDIEVDDDVLAKIASMVKVEPPVVDLAGIEAQLAALGERLAALERSEDARREEWQKDMPARKATVVTYRPREAAKGKAAPMSLADAANAILDNK